jgi:hypothetical protein
MSERATTTKVMNSWTFGGVNLSSFGAVTELDSYLDLPTKRNENVLVPLVDGRIHATKFFDQRTVSIGIEVMAENIKDMDTTFDTIKKLFGSRAQQYLEYRAPTGLRHALAEVTGSLGVTRDPDPLVAKIVVDFLLSEPFFRSTVIYSKEVTVNGTTAMDILNAGTVDERAAIITFTGPLQHPKIEHIASGIWVQYDAHITGTDTVIIDCKNFTAVHSVSGNVINSVFHHGDPNFLPIPADVDTNAHHFHATNLVETTGKAKVEFYAPYL